MKSEKYSAECTWGDGPDIVMSIHNEQANQHMLCDLTSEEARALAYSLHLAANRDELERICKDHDDMMKALGMG